MPFNTSPVEILCQLFSSLEAPDLFTIASTNSRWSASTQEALYQLPILFPVTLMLFLRTILTPRGDIFKAHVRTRCQLARIPIPVDRFCRLTTGLRSRHQPRFPEPRGITQHFVELLLHLSCVHSLCLNASNSAICFKAFLGATAASFRISIARRTSPHISCITNNESTA